MSSFIVCWMANDPGVDDEQKDCYQPFTSFDYDDPRTEAKKFYESLLLQDNVYSANLCEILESTDYDGKEDKDRRNSVPEIHK